MTPNFFNIYTIYLRVESGTRGFLFSWPVPVPDIYGYPTLIWSDEKNRIGYPKFWIGSGRVGGFFCRPLPEVMAGECFWCVFFCIRKRKEMKEKSFCVVFLDVCIKSFGSFLRKNKFYTNWEKKHDCQTSP